MIPQFKTTNEAIAFGEKATPAQIEELKTLRENLLAKIKEKQEEHRKTKRAELMDEMFGMAAMTQFYREAIEEHEKKPKEIKKSFDMFSRVLLFFKGGMGAGNFGHKGRAGQRGGSAKGGIVQSAFSQTTHTGGASASLEGSKPKTGFMVSPYKEKEKIVNLKLRKENKKELVKAIKDFRDKNKELLSKAGHYLGVWSDKGKLYFDISVNTETIDGARSIAKKYNQLAVWDVKQGQEIRL